MYSFKNTWEDPETEGTKNQGDRIYLIGFIVPSSGDLKNFIIILISLCNNRGSFMYFA